MAHHPIQYFDDLYGIKLSDIGPTYLQIVKRTQFDELETDTDEPPALNFYGCTVEQVYNFYKRHLQPPENSEAWENSCFSKYTFVAIDEECLEFKPYQCIIGSDAPDFGEAEDEIKLKTLRVDLEEIPDVLNGLEMLTRTPRETSIVRENDPDYIGLTLRPTPPWRQMYRDDDGVMVFDHATPKEARANKRRGIQTVERMGWAVGEGPVNDTAKNREHKRSRRKERQHHARCPLT